MTSRCQGLRIEIRFAAKLHDAFRDTVRVLLFLSRMFEELGLCSSCMNARRHVVMSFVAEHADHLSRKSIIEDLQNRFTISLIGLGHGAFFDVLAGALP